MKTVVNDCIIKSKVKYSTRKGVKNMKFKRSNEEKSLRFSIRKYHVGAVSVALSALLFLGNSAVYAQNENNVSRGGDKFCFW